MRRVIYYKSDKHRFRQRFDNYAQSGKTGMGLRRKTLKKAIWLTEGIWWPVC